MSLCQEFYYSIGLFPGHFPLTNNCFALVSVVMCSIIYLDLSVTLKVMKHISSSPETPKYAQAGICCNHAGQG